MGRKRKVLKGSNTNAKEDDTTNACPETSEEKILSHTDGSLDTKEAMNVETTERPDSSDLQPKKKTSKVIDGVVRRSTRVKTPVSHFGTQKVKSPVEYVNLAENEKNEEAQGEQVTTTIVNEGNPSNACLETPSEEKIQSEAINVESEKEVATQVQQVNTLQASDEVNLVQEESQVHDFNTVQPVIESNLEKKVDYIVRAVDEFKYKDTEWPNEGNEGPSTRMNYKTLYMNSQRKIEEMMEKNFDLVRKLEFALGKIEAYEKMMVGMGSAKEMMLVPSQAKATEAPQRGISITDNGPNDDTADVQKQKASSPKQMKKYQKRKGKA